MRHLWAFKKTICALNRILSPLWFGFKFSTHDAIISTTIKKKKFVGVAKEGDYKFTYNIHVSQNYHKSINAYCSQMQFIFVACYLLPCDNCVDVYCSQMQFILVTCNLLPCDNCVDAYCSQMWFILVTCNLFPSIASTIWHTITKLHFLHN